jgi:hypothetical protein
VFALRRCVSRLFTALALASSLFAAGCASTVPEIPAPVVAPPSAELAQLARRAVSADPAIAAPAIAALRAAGPAGLDALFAAWPEGVAALLNARTGERAPAEPDLARLRSAIERVARQRDAHASRLYWYTDLDEAVRVARATHEPILSLRLLGDLDEELSCANSRFFRTMLYPDARVAALLRDRFVLHWKSERPAPRITIDFGDGRKMERTITGNSIHYVLDEAGRPVDAIPGLYGPKAFVRALETARAEALAVAQLGGGARVDHLRAHHARARDVLAAEWAAEVAALGAPGKPQPALLGSPSAAPSAAAAAPLAMSKMAVEAPMVGALQGPVGPLPVPSNDAILAALVARHAGDAQLDAASRALIAHKIATEVDTNGTALRPLDGDTFARRLAAFEKTLAEDTVRNEHTMHRTLHEWLAQGGSLLEDVEALNQKVYATLFLTPRSDPWLGLYAPDVYSGIENEGLVIAPPARGKQRARAAR